MQDVVVDVEVNLKIREEKRKAEEEERLYSLIKESEQIMQSITLKIEGLEHQNTSVLQREEIDIHEPISPKSDDIFTVQYMDESPDLLCEYHSFSSFSCLPKYDQYDEDYAPQIQINLAEELEAFLGESNVQVLQPEPSDVLAHFNYEEREENAENFEANEGNLPFCFESFQFIKDNYHAVCNQMSTSFDISYLEESQILAHNALPLVLQPPNATKCQILEEDLEAAACDQMIQAVSLPLYFESSKLFKEREE